MAQPTQDVTTSPSIDEAFTADRQMFWNRFTGFTTWAVIGVVAVLLVLLVFVY